MKRILLAMVVLGFALCTQVGAGDKKKADPPGKEPVTDYVVEGEISSTLR